MGFKKVCVYGFGMNEYFFMMPAIRYVLCNINHEIIPSLATFGRSSDRQKNTAMLFEKYCRTCV